MTLDPSSGGGKGANVPALDIVIRTRAAGKLAAAARSAVVAFETDSVDLGTHTRWSVTAVGQARAALI